MSVINFNVLNDKLKNINKQKYTLFVGWDTPEMSKIAAIQEYGATITVTDKMRGFLSAKYGIHLKKSTTQIVIPPRAHRYQVVKENDKKWTKELKKILIQNKFDVKKSLDILGYVMAQDYKTIIKNANFDKLSEATLLIRHVEGIAGSAPLNATGEMERQITSEVYKA
jgi:hypothetical protein